MEMALIVLPILAVITGGFQQALVLREEVDLA